jgi:hypothetical protein
MILRFANWSQEEMTAWWTTDGKALSERLHPPTRFRRFEKEELEEVTGRLPIFLRIVRDAKLPNAAVLDELRPLAGLGGVSVRVNELKEALFDSEEANKWTDDVAAFWYNNVKRLNFQAMEK